MNRAAALSLGLAIAVASGGVRAWSDSALGMRVGDRFAEPFNLRADGAATDIQKFIVWLTHVAGDHAGTTFANIDVLKSDRRDPIAGQAGRPGALEVYGVFRATVDLGYLANANLAWGPGRSVGLTGGVDLNRKDDEYGSRKQMVVLGPTWMLDMPGFVNVSALWLWESNRPDAVGHRFTYRGHGALQATFGVPLGQAPVSLNGYAQYIGAKGINEFGSQTASETHVDASLMWNLGQHRIGVGHEYWRNKFGNPTHWVGGSNAGATARTWMLRYEVHL